MLVGFSLVGAPPRSRVYPADEFEADVAAAGLVVESRFATFDLRPFGPDGDFASGVLGPVGRARGRATPACRDPVSVRLVLARVSLALARHDQRSGVG